MSDEDDWKMEPNNAAEEFMEGMIMVDPKKGEDNEYGGKYA